MKILLCERTFSQTALFRLVLSAGHQAMPPRPLNGVERSIRNDHANSSSHARNHDKLCVSARLPISIAPTTISQPHPPSPHHCPHRPHPPNHSPLPSSPPRAPFPLFLNHLLNFPPVLSASLCATKARNLALGSSPLNKIPQQWSLSLTNLLTR